MSVYGYRRGSIFWALTLIGVGAIFLYQNFNPQIHPWQIIAKYWPILIIFWGLSKLVDFIQAQAHPETTPPPLFSGSEVVLLILILVMGTIVSRVVLKPWSQWGGIHIDDDELGGIFTNSYTYTDTLSKAVKPQPHLIVEDQHGDLEIRASDQAKIEVVAKKAIRAEDESAAKKLADQLKVEIVEEAGHYLLRSNRRSLSEGGNRVRLDLVLRVPFATSAEVTSERGDIVMDGLHGDQALTSLKGDTRVSNVEGLVRVHKTGGLTEVREVKGSVELDGRGGDVEISGVSGTVTVNGEFSGSVQFRNIAQTARFTSSRTNLMAQKLTGRMEMEVGSLDLSGIDGPFELATKQKDITLTDFKHSVKISNNNGNVDLRTSYLPAHPIEVDLKKGAIELQLPSNSNFQIEANSPHGEVDCDFSGSGLKIVREGENPSISGSYGKGGPLIHLSTEYGAIRLGREGVGSAAPPALPPEPHAPAPPKPAKPPETTEPSEQTSWRRPHRLRHNSVRSVGVV